MTEILDHAITVRDVLYLGGGILGFIFLVGWVLTKSTMVRIKGWMHICGLMFENPSKTIERRAKDWMRMH